MASDEVSVALVHGAFAESASWNGVISHLDDVGVRAIAIANPLRSVATDSDYVADVVRGVGESVVLVGHSYGGVVITEAAAKVSNVAALVYVAAFAPDQGESAATLSGMFPGSTLGPSLRSTRLDSGDVDLTIREDLFRDQFCADVDFETAKLMARTQRAITERALQEPLRTADPGWRTHPSWFVHASEDRNIPATVIEYLADRAAAREVTVVEGASHALAVSQPGVVAETILRALGR